VIREKVLKFGPTRGLVGILTEPPPDAPPRLPVVFLNSGILHHVGASRLYVRMARKLAEMGHPCFRFDFSGIGDSEPRRDTMTAAESAVVEAREAMDLVGARKGGVDRFILIGLCSGADMGFKTAQVDERVVGLVQLDPFAYRTPGYWLRHYGLKVFRLKAWQRFIGVRYQRWKDARTPKPPVSEDEAATYVAPEYRRRFPPRDQVAEAMRKLVSRKVQMLNIFSDEQTEHINHGAQYRNAFPDVPFGGQLEVAYVKHSAHTFTELSDQERVLAVVTAWSARAMPTLPSASTATGPSVPPPAPIAAQTNA
jgi:pimeloyl-ACP methyl ester carboxylesterase